MRDQYIRLPLAFYKKLPALSDKEIRVFLCINRETTGWEREWHKLSVSFFCRATGLVKNSVLTALDMLIEKHLIERRPIKNSFQYRISMTENGSKNEPISTYKNGSKNEPKNGSKNEPKMAQKMNPIHRTEIKTKKRPRTKPRADVSNDAREALSATEQRTANIFGKRDYAAIAKRLVEGRIKNE